MPYKALVLHHQLKVTSVPRSYLNNFANGWVVVTMNNFTIEHHFSKPVITYSSNLQDKQPKAACNTMFTSFINCFNLSFLL